MTRRPPRSTLFPYPTLSRSPPRQPLFWTALAFSLGLWTGVRAWRPPSWWVIAGVVFVFAAITHQDGGRQDRKSTRLNSSHQILSYAVFFFKKKKYKSDAESP